MASKSDNERTKHVINHYLLHANDENCLSLRGDVKVTQTL